MNPTDSQSSIVNPKYDPCRPFKEGDLVRMREVNGFPPCDRNHCAFLKEGEIGELGKKVKGNDFEVFFSLWKNKIIDSAYFELVAPAEENGDRFFLHRSIGLYDSRYEIYHGSYRDATFVCSFSDKFFTKEKAEEEIAILCSLHQQPAKEN